MAVRAGPAAAVAPRPLPSGWRVQDLTPSRWARSRRVPMGSWEAGGRPGESEGLAQMPMGAVRAAGDGHRSVSSTAEPAPRHCPPVVTAGHRRDGVQEGSGTQTQGRWPGRAQGVPFPPGSVLRAGLAALPGVREHSAWTCCFHPHPHPPACESVSSPAATPQQGPARRQSPRGRAQHGALAPGTLRGWGSVGGAQPG